MLRRFQRYTNAYPWQWTPQDVEEWTTAAIAERGLAHSTVRFHHVTLRLFLDYLADRRYGWAGECERRFGAAPEQVCHEWNTVAHLADYEGRPGNRPLTREELQAFFNHADDEVVAIRGRGRKGWLPAFRDATMLKVAYGWGLRRRETAWLDRADLGRNPKAPEFGELGIVRVRWGKASRGGPPRRRAVLTVFDWAAEALEHYLAEVRPRFGAAHDGLWPTERGGRVSLAAVDDRFARYRDALGLPAELGPHCLRHSYTTHLIEDGWDAMFVQRQLGHAWASTTAIYTGVSGDYQNRVLRDVLDRRLPPAAGKEG
jgi:integrase/recombinase XerC